MALPLESVPNVSEGRDQAKLAELRTAFSAPARLLDVHTDWDHHRSVFTLVGAGPELVETLLAGIAAAAERIDLRAHEGAHPRIGAADVVPSFRSSPKRKRRRATPRSGWPSGSPKRSAYPVFFYGRLTDDGREPAFFRRGGAASSSGGWTSASCARIGGRHRLHPTAGGVLVGVRRPLVAFNVNLRSADVEAAREIARLVRERDGGFPGVRALGLDLPRAGLVQVSMNVTDWQAASLVRSSAGSSRRRRPVGSRSRGRSSSA